MTTSTRFAAAVHLLVGLALDDEPVSSDRLAASLNTHPTVVRRLLASLSRAGLTTARRGARGGALLSRPAAQIGLLDIYLAVESPDFVAMHGCDGGSAGDGAENRCPVADNIIPVLTEVASRAEQAFREELAGVTVADVARDVTRRATARSLSTSDQENDT